MTATPSEPSHEEVCQLCKGAGMIFKVQDRNKRWIYAMLVPEVPPEGARFGHLFSWQGCVYKKHAKCSRCHGTGKVTRDNPYVPMGSDPFDPFRRGYSSRLVDEVPSEDEALKTLLTRSVTDAWDKDKP